MFPLWSGKPDNQDCYSSVQSNGTQTQMRACFLKIYVYGLQFMEIFNISLDEMAIQCMSQSVTESPVMLPRSSGWNWSAESHTKLLSAWAPLVSPTISHLLSRSPGSPHPRLLICSSRFCVPTSWLGYMLFPRPTPSSFPILHLLSSCLSFRKCGSSVTIWKSFSTWACLANTIVWALGRPRDCSRAKVSSPWFP